jgi:hypothetical protein
MQSHSRMPAASAVWERSDDNGPPCPHRPPVNRLAHEAAHATRGDAVHLCAHELLVVQRLVPGRRLSSHSFSESGKRPALCSPSLVALMQPPRLRSTRPVTLLSASTSLSVTAGHSSRLSEVSLLVSLLRSSFHSPTSSTTQPSSYLAWKRSAVSVVRPHTASASSASSAQLAGSESLRVVSAVMLLTACRRCSPVLLNTHPGQREEESVSAVCWRAKRAREGRSCPPDRCLGAGKAGQGNRAARGVCRTEGRWRPRALRCPYGAGCMLKELRA